MSESVWDQCWEGVPVQELESWEHEGQDGNLYKCRYALKNAVHHYGAYLERDVWCIVTGERDAAHESLYTWIQIHSILKSGEQQ
jgi:hypothetical protein